MIFRFSKKIKLPGFVIKIRFVDGRTLPKTTEGSWDYNRKKKIGTIDIRDSLTLNQKKLALAHELQHAMVDYLHCICPEEKKGD